MAEETWNSRAIPIMEAIAVNEDPHEMVTLDDLSQATGLSHVEVEVELERLIDGEYIQGDIHRTMAGGQRGHWRLDGSVLLERGSRTVGQWPSDDPYEALLALIDKRLLDTTLDEASKTKLQRFHSTLVDVGKGTAGGVLAALIKASVGL